MYLLYNEIILGSISRFGDQNKSYKNKIKIEFNDKEYVENSLFINHQRK